MQRWDANIKNNSCTINLWQSKSVIQNEWRMGKQTYFTRTVLMIGMLYFMNSTHKNREDKQQ
ncbi:hypothetical protein B649_08955 [Candidatus Sulfuricurvum sp. RIFRC-1]|nr:hypothetical protein B649_08955 [Candidatus Sulfuricurvum sp. RIFRC-1]OHD84937.1 MAG: hypothetical protein A2Y52_06445 [Sulfuricurvum sp. RIFCSPLOWO2_02_43_6]OHD88278.1 MAG: hypothetical protein A3G19_07910 [Sulfuricurvum sp. RIFCSPLOWO2_12_FULL_43_24]HBM36291.1 hypothetical protein [Sulfuricurvum sp.]